MFMPEKAAFCQTLCEKSGLVMTFAAGDDLVQEFAFIRTPGGSPDPSGGVHVQEESQTTE
jgi:hypothetical protein